MRTLLFFCFVLSFLMLCACGTQAEGDGNPGANPDTPPPAEGVSLGSRAVPGYTVQATRMSAVHAGQPVTIRITVQPEAGRELPHSVEAWAGGEFDASAAPVKALAVTALAITENAATDQSGVYEASFIVPDPLPMDCAAWTRLRLSDGSVLELGRCDFQLSAAP